MGTGKIFGDHRLPSKQLKEFTVFSALKLTIAKTGSAHTGSTPHTDYLRKENEETLLGLNTIFIYLYYSVCAIWHSMKNYEIHTQKRIQKKKKKPTHFQEIKQLT